MEYNLLGVSISMDTLKLFKGLHLVHGKNDDSGYFSNVCNNYTTKVKQVLKKMNINNNSQMFQMAVIFNDADEIERGLDILSSLVDFYNELKKSFNNNVDLTKYDTTNFPTNSNIVSKEISEWINKANAKLKACPKGACFASSNIVDNPFSIFEFNFSDGTDIIDTSNLNALEKHLNGESYRTPSNCYGNSLCRVHDYEENNRNSNPTTNSYRVAEEVGKRLANNYNNILTNSSIILDAILKAIKNEVAVYNYKATAEIRKKRTSFFIGMGIWVLFAVGISLLCFLFKFNPYGRFTFIKSTIWGNIWKTVICILVFAAANLPFAILYYRYDSGESDSFAPFNLQIVPKGIVTLLMVYLVWIFDFKGTFAANLLVPYRIFGTILLVLTVIFELSDVIVPDEIENNVFMHNFNNHRGLIWYSNVFVLYPFAILLAFAWTFTFLAVGAVWVLTIIASIMSLAMIIVISMMFRDFRR